MASKRETQQRLEQCRKTCDELRDRIGKLLEQTDAKILRQMVSSNGSPEPVKYQPIQRRVYMGHFGKIYALHWGHESKYIVTASQDGKLIIWDAFTANKKLALTLPSAWVMTCAFSPDNSMIASGGLDNIVTIHKVSEGTNKSNNTNNNNNNNDKSNQGGAQSNDFTSKTVYRELEQHDGYVSCARFVDNNTVISSSGDGSILLWDVESKTSTKSFMEHTGDVMFVSLNKENSSLFCSGSVDATVKIWDIRTSEKYVGNFAYHQADVNTVNWYADMKAVLSGSDDGSVRLLDMRSFRQLNEYINVDNQSLHSADPSGVTSVDCSLTGRFFFSSFDNGSVYLWDTLHGTWAHDLKHENRVSAVAVSPNGYGLATACWDFNMRLFA
jgi:guanine nucleotide-binding protein G(I)/G(S)/G(T) subunit beta-1